MRAFILAAALAVAAARVAAADPPRAVSTLTGRVTDTTDAPLPQVRVTVHEVARFTVTDADGRYTLTGLPTGTYAVSFALVGYTAQVRRVTLREGTVTLDVTMRPTLVELQELQVTASPLATTSLTSPQPTSVLSGPGPPGKPFGDSGRDHQRASRGQELQHRQPVSESR